MVRQLGIPWRQVSSVLCLTVLSAPGCSSSRSAASASVRPAQPTPPVSAKALVTLEGIEPAIEAPAGNPNVLPLSDSARQQIAKAKALLAEQRYTEAAIELERALRTDPNHPAIHAVLSVLHWQAGNIERAKTHAQRSIEVTPDLAAPHYVMGRYQMKFGEPNSALYEFRTAILCPDFPADREIAALARYHLADLLAGEGYLAAALNQYDRFEADLAALKDTAAGRTFSTDFNTIMATMPVALAEPRARLLSQMGRHAEAAEALQAVLKARPQDTAIATQYAEALLKSGRLDQAFEAVRSIPANDLPVIQMIYDIGEQAGKPELAMNELLARIRLSPDDSELALRVADVLAGAGKPDDARQILASFLHDWPAHQSVRFRLVELHLLTGDWAQAVHLAARLIRESPAECESVRRLFAKHASDRETAAKLLEAAGEPADFATGYLAGVIAYEGGRHADAERWLTLAIEQTKGLSPGRVSLAQLKFDQYRYSEAIDLLSTGQEDTPQTAESERLLARIYDRLDDLAQAEKHYRNAISLDRTDEATMIDLAEMFFRSGQPLQAQRQLQIILQQNPDNERARELLGLTFWQLQKPDLSIAEFQELQRRSKRPAVIARCRIMTDQQLRQNPAESRRVLLEAIEAGEPDASAWLALASTYDDHELAEQRRAYTNAATLDPDREDAVLGLIRADQLELDFESAAKRLAGLLERRPNRHEWRRRLIDLYLVTGQFNEALNAAEPQLKRDDLGKDERTAYRAAYLNILNWAGRGDEVVAQLKRWTEENRDEKTWPDLLARHHMIKARPAAAAEVYEQLHRRDPTNQDWRARMITALVAAKNEDRAAQFALDWLDQDPNDDRSIALLASAIAEGGQVDPALELVRNRLTRTFNRELFQDWTLAQLAEAERFDPAVELAESLVDNVLRLLRMSERGDIEKYMSQLREDELAWYPNPRAHPNQLPRRLEILRDRLIATLIGAEDYNRAFDLLNEWLEQVNEPELRYRYLRLLAAAHQYAGQEDKAAVAMERALLLRPNDVGLNNDLAYVWIDRGVRLKDAEPLIRHAVGSAPEQPAYLDTYGWLLYKKGDFAGAELWLKRAGVAARASRTRQDPVILDHLGDSLWRQGRRDQAIDYWAEAVELVKDKKHSELNNADERRVKDFTPSKIDAARSGGEPAVAPLEVPVDQQNGSSRTERT